MPTVGVIGGPACGENSPTAAATLRHGVPATAAGPKIFRKSESCRCWPLCGTPVKAPKLNLSFYPLGSANPQVSVIPIFCPPLREHIFTRKSRWQPLEFLSTSAKRVLQHNPSASGHRDCWDLYTRPNLITPHTLYALLPQSIIDPDAEATDIYVHLLRLVLSNNFLNPTGYLHGVHVPANSTFKMRRPRLQATLVLSGPMPAGSTPTIRPQPKSSSIRSFRALMTSAGGMKLSNELEINASLAIRGNSWGSRSPSCCCFARRQASCS